MKFYEKIFLLYIYISLFHDKFTKLIYKCKFYIDKNKFIWYYILAIKYTGENNMCISYEKLWVLLAERNIGKNDLCSAAGISSRTMAKLSKNESVTTDTLSKICEVLNCDIGDIATFSHEPVAISLYDAYKKQRRKTSETEFLNVYEFSYSGQRFIAFVTKKTANKCTIIECQNNDIKWRQLSKTWRLDGTGAFLGIVDLIARMSPDKDAVDLFIISGKPGEIKGLDDGIFRSARKFGGEGYINVMSEAAFKCLTLPKSE